jgi:hypothetical protein
MELTTETKTKKKSAVLAGKASKEAEKSIELARDYYCQMQRDWFMFAKQVKEIRDKNYADYLGDESFLKLCEREFPQVSYTTISKFILIVERLGDQIERRLEKDEYRLPSYTSCYQLTTIESKVKDEDFTKLRKQLLDEKLTEKSFRERVQELVTVAKKQLRAKIEAEADHYIEKTQRELDEELKKDPSWEEDSESRFSDEDFDPEGVDLEEVEVDEDEEDDSASTHASLLARIDYLEENLPDYADQVEKMDKPNKLILKRLKKFQVVLDEAITTLEEK